MATTLDLVREDINIVLARIFKTADIFMFGEDGNGQHGTRDTVLRGPVSMYDVSVSADDEDEPSDIYACVKIYVSGYDADLHGHAMTDNNLRICLDQIFQAEHVDASAWDWAGLSMQERHQFAIMLDVPRFLDWA